VGSRNKKGIRGISEKSNKTVKFRFQEGEEEKTNALSDTLSENTLLNLSLNHGEIYLGKKQKQGEKVAWEAITEEQRRKHILWLNRIKKLTSWSDVINCVEKLRAERGWRASTTRTTMGTILGAKRREDYYGIRTSLGPPGTIVQDYMKAVTLQEIDQLHTTTHPFPAQWNHIRRAVRSTTRTDLQTYLLLMWFTVSRPGCITKQKKENIKIERGNQVRVLFTAGKGVRLRKRPYTIFTEVPGNMAQIIRKYLSEREGELFQQQVQKDALILIRKIDSRLSLRSIRRGAAIQLAEKGTPIEIIREFTGHATNHMCERYLGWGWHLKVYQKKHKKFVRALVANIEDGEDY